MITLHVEAETMNELILKATDALYGHTMQDAEHLYTALTNPAAPVIPAKAVQKPMEQTKNPETAVKAAESRVSAPDAPVEETPAPQSESATATKTGAENAAPAKTLTQMRELIGKAVQQPAGKAALAGYLAECGVKKLPELDPSHYDGLLARMADFLPEGAA